MRVLKIRWLSKIFTQLNIKTIKKCSRYVKIFPKLGKFFTIKKSKFPLQQLLYKLPIFATDLTEKQTALLKDFNQASGYLIYKFSEVVAQIERLQDVILT